MTGGQKQAINLLGVYTGKRYDFWMLAGPRNGKIRAIILSAIRRVKVPVAMAGVTALRAAFYEFAPVTGDCEAARAESFVAWAKQEDK